MHTEGKAKILDTDRDHLIVTFKDSATAFNGVKKAEMPGKGNLNAQLTALLFALLAEAGLATCYVGKGSNPNQLRYTPLTMIPLEVVVHNDAYGSLCKRYGLEQGWRLPQPTVEFFVKNDGLNDPLITDDLLTLLGYLPDGVTVTDLKLMALAANECLVSYFEGYGIRCADFKLEFGLDAKGRLTLGDELSPDNFRLRDSQTGQVLDKDVFRQDLGDLVTTYQQLWERLQGEPIQASPSPSSVNRNYRARVVVKSRKNILNPESKAILEAVHSLGHHDVLAVNAGKQFELAVSAPNWSKARQRVEHLADFVLSNPVIEDVEVMVEAGQALTQPELAGASA